MSSLGSLTDSLNSTPSETPKDDATDFLRHFTKLNCILCEIGAARSSDEEDEDGDEHNVSISHDYVALLLHYETSLAGWRQELPACLVLPPEPVPFVGGTTSAESLTRDRQAVVLHAR